MIDRYVANLTPRNGNADTERNAKKSKKRGPNLLQCSQVPAVSLDSQALSIYIFISQDGRVRVLFLRGASSVRGLEDHLGLLGSFSEGDTEFEELGDDGGKVLEEEIIILGVLLYPLLEGFVGYEGQVGG